MKTTTLRLMLACFCALFAVTLFAEPPSVTNDTPANFNQANSLADQANTKLQQAQTREDYQAAANMLAKAASLDPNNLEVRKTLGWVYLEKLHQPDLAYPYIVTVAKVRTNDVDALKLYGMACSQTGRLSRAVDAFRQASHLNPGDLWIRANLARNLARLGHYHEAHRIYTEILQADPKNADARLGEAELEAWRGHTAAPLQSLDSLLKENPTNADALVLEGDIHRWNWDIAEARSDYQQALQAVPDDYDAKKGLKDADQQADTSLTLKGYDFKDNTGFARYSVGADTRIYLADKAYLLAGGSTWRFENPGFDELDSIVAHLGLEYDFNRWLQASVEGTGFGYEHRDAIPGGRASVKVSPFHGLDIYTTVSYQDPFVSSMPTVEQALKQDSIGNGIDLKIIGPLSFQNSFQAAEISDHNNWYEEKPQLSYHLLSHPSIYVRAQYDYLNYSQSRTNYWTPNNWHTAGPVLDLSIPICPHFRIDANGQMPFVFTEDRFGYVAEAGPAFDLGRRCQFKISYIYAKIPGTIGANSVPWSGHGGQFSLVFNF